MGKIYPAAKVVLNDETLLDVTGTTATPTEIAKGFKIVSATGAEIEGTLKTQIFTCKIYNDPTIEDDVEETVDWFINAEAAKTAIMTSDDFILRDGDFLILLEYFSKGAGNTLTGEPARETYVYHVDDDTGVKSWVTIGSTTMCDDYTITLVDGKVSLCGADGLAPNEGQEFIPCIALDTDSQKKIIKWIESNSILDKIAEIEKFFKDNPTIDNVIDTLKEVDSAMPLTWNAIAKFGKTLEQIQNTNFSDAIPGSFFNKKPKANECFEIVGITADKRKIIFKAQIDEPTANSAGNIKFKRVATEPIVIMTGGEGAGPQAEIFNDYINNKATGMFSHAEGQSTIANAFGCHAEGDQTIASGYAAHAEGHFTSATGKCSHAEGDYTTASGDYSHAEGTSTNKANSVEADLTDNSSILDKWATKKFSLAKGHGSHVEGKDNLALGDRSHTEGKETIAMGNYSHAEGQKTQATGLNAHAEGGKTKAEGQSSHAEGVATIAKGHGSHAEGYYTEANGLAQHVEGSYNIIDATCENQDKKAKYAHIVGNGTGLGSKERSNAHTLDWEGNAWFAGDVYVDSTSGTNKDTGSKKLATEERVPLQYKITPVLNNITYAELLTAIQTDDGYTNALVNNSFFNRPPILNERFGFTAITKDNRIVLCYATVTDLDQDGEQNGQPCKNTGFKIKGAADVDLITDPQEKERAIAAEEALAAAISAESSTREAADEDLSQQLTTMDAAIAGHTQSISDLSSGLEGLGNVLEDNYYSKSEIDQKLQDLPSSGGGGNADITIDSGLSIESQNPLANQALSKILLAEPVAHFASANACMNVIRNLRVEENIYTPNTTFTIQDPQGLIRKCVIIDNGIGCKQPNDYEPAYDSVEIYINGIENEFFTPNTITCFTTTGTNNTPENTQWRIAVMKVGSDGYTKEQTDTIINELATTYATKSDLNNYVTTTDVEQICKDELAGHGIEYQVKGNNRSATPLITEEGKYYWLRQISTGQDLCGLWWPGKDTSNPADISFSEMEFVCANGVGFLGYRYRASNAENWTYGKTSVPSGTAIMLGPGTIVQKTPVALI